MKVFVSFAILFLPTLCAAQNNNDEDKKLTFGYNYGASLPQGNYAKTTDSKLPISRLLKQDTTDLNGYAKKGVHYDIYLCYKIIPHLSILLAVYGDQNSYDANTLNSQYITFFRPNTVAVQTGDNYYVVQYLIGPYINIPISKRLSAEVKLLGGLTTANYPSLIYFGKDTDLLYTIPKTSALGYNVGVGFKYKVVKSRDIDLGLHLNVNYSGSTIIYPGYSITEYTPSNVFLNSSNYNVHQTMTINVVQVTFGITLEFQNLWDILP